METRYGGCLPDWRYRAIARPAAAHEDYVDDDFELEAHSRLAAHSLPFCFAEMDYPHWRRVPLSAGDPRSASYYVGDSRPAREAALTRLILCSRCPVFDRCHKLTTAKKSPDPSLASAKRKTDLLAALSHM